MSTVASVVNLAPSQVYHTERPPLFAARLRTTNGPDRAVGPACVCVCLQTTSFELENDPCKLFDTLVHLYTM